MVDQTAYANCFEPSCITSLCMFVVLWQILEPLTAIIVKDRLEEADVLECKQVIYRVVAMEHRNEALPVTASGIRGKGAKR